MFLFPTQAALINTISAALIIYGDEIYAANFRSTTPRLSTDAKAIADKTAKVLATEKP